MSLFIHDSLLGHVPNPGFCTPGFAGSFHTIDAEGFRFGGERPASSEGPILAVGDSFTYGDEVRDEEAWPAQLQRITGRPVLNGGVTGYGLDQIVLRAEQLIPRYKPSVVIVGFIEHDIQRTEMRRMWWRDKPWFEIDGDQLVLKGVPVPNPPSRLSRETRHRVETFLVELPVILQQLLGYRVRVHPVGRGLTISRRLAERLAALSAQHGVPMIMMAQYPPLAFTDRRTGTLHRRRMKAVLERAQSRGLVIVDTFQRLAAEPQPEHFYGHTHMNARGNALVASLLAAILNNLPK
jgi:lysophospholipase L1-like esterase